MPANRSRTGRECARVSTIAFALAPALPFALRRPRSEGTLPAMESAPSDVLLVARCANGDEGALAELYDLFGRAAYALALRIVRDASQAEDVVQEAFLDLWRSASRFDPSRSRPASYLLTFVHRRAVDLVRREQARPQRGGDVDDIADRAGKDDIAASLVASEQGQSVRRALAGLPPPQREVLELAYFNGLSQSEIAEHLGEPLGTVKSRTHVALSRLRELLGEGFHA
jgi:RNA polymerase sigma-70 factor (ECF subfamily)